MELSEWIIKHETLISLTSTVVLVLVTGIYVWLTKRILQATVKQSNLTYNPVIGIKIKKMGIGKVFGKSRRNMGVELELTNVGNAPAIEVLIDAEIKYSYSKIEGHDTIPARFEPDIIPFIRPDEIINDEHRHSPSFGNTSITHLFDDFRESQRLNIHRIETNPSDEPFNASSLKIIIYYKNNLGQYFESIYETNLHLGLTPETKYPKEDESVELSQIYIPRPKFHAQPISKEKVENEINTRNKRRNLCGW